MTGPEHYKQAERLLSDSANDDGSMEGTEIYIAAAQVHATLALAAAMGMESDRAGNFAAWIEVAGDSVMRAMSPILPARLVAPDEEPGLPWEVFHIHIPVDRGLLERSAGREPERGDLARSLANQAAHKLIQLVMGWPSGG